MLRKLIKYDLKWINKLMVIYFIISIIICTLTRVSSYFTSSFVGNIIYLILRGFAISCFVSVMINCVIRIWVRFRNNTYKDESYLTHTLPVTKEKLYNSKILSSIISILISVVVVILCLVIAFLNKDVIEALKNIVSNVGLFTSISFIIIAILEIIYMMFSGIIGILIGYRSNNGRNIKAVIIGIVSYFTIQLIIIGIIYCLGLLNSNLNSLFTDSNVYDVGAIKHLVIMVGIVYIVFITIMYFVGKKLFKKGVNVD